MKEFILWKVGITKVELNLCEKSRRKRKKRRRKMRRMKMRRSKLQLKFKIEANPPLSTYAVCNQDVIRSFFTECGIQRTVNL